MTDYLRAFRPLFIHCKPEYWVSLNSVRRSAQHTMMYNSLFHLFTDASLLQYVETLEMARRLALTSVTLIFHGSGNLLLFGLCVNSIAIVVHRELMPYIDMTTNVIRYIDYWMR